MPNDEPKAEQAAETPVKIKQEPYLEWTRNPEQPGEDPLVPVREEISPGSYRFVLRRRSSLPPKQP
jgi:hypothetical protein